MEISPEAVVQINPPNLALRTQSEMISDKERHRDALYEEALREMQCDAPNPRKALVLLQEAHSAGAARATYALATWYLHGQPPVIRRNRRKALKLLEVAANANIPDALFDLAVFLEKGELGEADPKRAFEMYLRSALRNKPQSLYEVGRCYEYGIGIKKDRRLADIWLDRAQEFGIKT